ncbi:hypothetical protein C3489_20385 [Streptomyces sp. Ru71]|uniref:DUF1360 domain-containing protein n=1 Tax=Streptomyces sp. Ru71 TaxID=2080746 RepID=UPI000CDE453C|nr:DUF1360 domain-containing protein [Streptomyces sp. Ru71]POX51340.1 hypothetical protein C3489_20385 [Streptomyces sp. Ru71]
MTAPRYADEDEAPLGGYAALAATFTAGAALFTAVAHRRGVRPPERVPPWDVALMGTAVFKASRLLSKDKITSFLRAPFTRRAEEGDGSEVMDAPRGSGAQRAVGDLVSCPFCVAAWVAGALVGSYAVTPRGTRLVCAGLTALTAADWLQYAWTWAQSSAEG